MNAADVLKILSGAARVIAPLLPGMGKTIAGAAAEGFGQAADFADAGHEPVAMMRKLRERTPLLQEVDRSWERAYREKFKEELHAPDSEPDTQPSSPYPDDEES